MRRVFAIHDMSGIGKCSLTAALPIISAAGIECNPIPTAVLSSHTGNITGYTFRDLTDDMHDYFNHWKTLGIKPDTIYSGYLGSTAQVEAVSDLIDLFADKNTHIIIDPAMADSGKMYTGFDDSFILKMSELCKKADIITPNITEACFITGTEYSEKPDVEHIFSITKKLSEYTKRYIVLTGVSDFKDKTGCLIYDKQSDLSIFINSDKYPGTYYGTGDIFTSVLTACVTKGMDCKKAAEIALDFTYTAIGKTYNEKTDTRLGVAFEYYLGDLANKIGGLS